jgi:GxxExxY protein
MIPSRQANEFTRRIIGCCINVHRQLGPGLLESIYQDALCLELAHEKLAFRRGVPVPVKYRGRILSTPLQLDLIVESEVIVELKSTETILVVHEAQLLSYMRLADKQWGLLVNFNVPVLKDGVRRKTLHNNSSLPPL